VTAEFELISSTKSEKGFQLKNKNKNEASEIELSIRALFPFNEMNQH
jgi:hypothetical protein